MPGVIGRLVAQSGGCVFFLGELKGNDTIRPTRRRRRGLGNTFLVISDVLVYELNNWLKLV